MNSRKSQKFGNYSPPKEDSRRPLTRQDTIKLYQTAREWPDIETELAIRVLLDYGLRIGELVHLRSDWVRKEYHNGKDEEFWLIQIPKFERCYGGKGEKATQQGNQDGLDLHRTSRPCTKCKDRSYKRKVAPKINGERRPDHGWLTEEQAKEYDFHPKSARSADKVWQLGELPETAETARKLKKFVSGQKYEQWPHQSNSARNRLNKVVEEADLALPERPSDTGVVPHALRHTYGCRLVEARVGEGIGMKQMRHQNSDVFEWYAQVRGVRTFNALSNAVDSSASLLHE
ncbi:hypothetical protein [Halorubrum distributum]|jgi:integrase|uniref:Tyrosine-type recombinase/integrase n=1 Tax=Halorubrum distributum TaxID=29283 RepID=A0A6B1IIK2_9EURY|nr:hypothetical protein [Halorubrum terrestre]MYL67040.1 tyrosine-type recombinase/integrase [Halorubrum terrestre]